MCQNNEVDYARKAGFIRANTALKSPENVPELKLYLADEAFDLWHATQKELTQFNMPPPFWAFAWAGGQALARFILDHPHWVRDKTVLDFAAGSGLVGFAALKAGAKHVTLVDIDPFANVAAHLNTQANGLEHIPKSVKRFSDQDVCKNKELEHGHGSTFCGRALAVLSQDIIGQEPDVDVVLAGDIFYDRALANAVIPWFSHLAKNGTIILAGDPNRSYRPIANITARASYKITVSKALEDTDHKQTTIWQFLPPHPK